MNRDEAIARIKAGLKARSSIPWSVTHGRGTTWGWITINAPPRRLVDGGLSDRDRADLAGLLGITGHVHIDGVSIPAGSDYWQEYVDRAEGREPAVIGTPYWD